jgi:hypothetical protein
VPDNQIEVVPGAIEDASDHLDEHPETRARFETVADGKKDFSDGQIELAWDVLSSKGWISPVPRPKEDGDAHNGVACS